MTMQTSVQRRDDNIFYFPCGVVRCALELVPLTALPHSNALHTLAHITPATQPHPLTHMTVRYCRTLGVRASLRARAAVALALAAAHEQCA